MASRIGRFFGCLPVAITGLCACGGQAQSGAHRQLDGVGGASSSANVEAGAGGSSTRESLSTTDGKNGGGSSTAGKLATGGGSTNSPFIGATNATGGTGQGPYRSTHGTGGAAALGGTTSTVGPKSAGGATISVSENVPAGGSAGAPSSNHTISSFTFPKDLVGTWLIGWSGGLEHYSWIHFSELDPDQGGEVVVLNASVYGLPDSTFFNCEGRGRWYLTAEPNKASVRLPTNCREAEFTLKVLSTRTPSASFRFPSATLESVFESETPNAVSQQHAAYKHPDTQCDAALTSCKSATRSAP